MHLIAALEQLGGIASRRELIAAGVPEDWLPFALSYAHRVVVRVRKGWYALRTAHPLLVRANRAGGMLACSSALKYYAGEDEDGPVHVLVPAAASRLLEGEARVIHYTRKRIRGRLVVSLETARAQAQACRGRQSPLPPVTGSTAPDMYDASGEASST